jgi:STE24 endopeptidase
MIEWLADKLSWTGGGPWLYGYVVFSIVMQFIEQYLNVRQWRRNCTTTVPDEVLDINTKDQNHSHCKACGAEYKSPNVKRKDEPALPEAKKDGNGAAEDKPEEAKKDEDAKDEKPKEKWVPPGESCANCGKAVHAGKSPEAFEKTFLESQAYTKDKKEFGLFKENFMFCWALLNLMIAPALWRYAWDTFDGDYREYKATLFWLFLQQWLDKPVSIPFSLYSTFVLEEKHGFNKMTLKLFFTDMVKNEIIAYVFGGLLIPLLIWIVKSTGELFYLYLWAFMQAFIFIMMWIYPNFIQPLFNKFEKLKDETLREKIEALAALHQFPLTNLFQIDGSKRSGHSNAYFFGFWKNKRIVLYDTLLHLKHDDILAILCHELGHWKFNHITFNLVITSVHMMVLFRLFGLVMYGSLSAGIIQQFGYDSANAVMISLMLFSMLFEPTERLVQLLMTMLSRTFEFQADSFALSNGQSDSLINGLIQIAEENKGDLNPDPWYSWYHFSHPPLVERLGAIRKAQEAQGSKKTD